MPELAHTWGDSPGTAQATHAVAREGDATLGSPAAAGVLVPALVPHSLACQVPLPWLLCSSWPAVPKHRGDFLGELFPCLSHSSSALLSACSITSWFKSTPALLPFSSMISTVVFSFSFWTLSQSMFTVLYSSCFSSATFPLLLWNSSPSHYSITVPLCFQMQMPSQNLQQNNLVQLQ